jgi:hypothetical protein
MLVPRSDRARTTRVAGPVVTGPLRTRGRDLDIRVVSWSSNDGRLPTVDTGDIGTT